MRIHRPKAHRLLALVAAGLLLSACGGGGPKIKIPEPPKPSKLEMQTTGAANLNPDGTGRASPLQIRVYGLRSLDAFNAADFFALYEKDEQILAADIVKREELILRAGETATVTRDFPPDAQFVAVMGAFRDIEHSKWRASAPLQAGTKARLAIMADAKSIAVDIEVEKPDAPPK